MLLGGIVSFFWASHATPSLPTTAPLTLTPSQQLARDRAMLAQLQQNASTEASAAKALAAGGGGAIPTLPPLSSISIPAVHAQTGASSVP